MQKWETDKRMNVHILFRYVHIQENIQLEE